MRKERMGVGMGLNLLLLLAMVATNILSLYHLASLRTTTTPSSNTQNALDPYLNDDLVPPELLAHLHTIRATIAHLSSSDPSDPSAPPPPPPPPELLLYARIAPIASACSDHPDLLRRFMTYTPFAPCPPSSSAAAEPLLLRGCHPLPRRRCFSPAPARPAVPPADPLFLPSHPAFDPAADASSFLASKSALDLTLFQLLNLARTHAAAPIRLGLDVGGGAGTLAARMRQLANATVVTTTLNVGAPYSEAAALRGLVPLHAPLQQRFPVPDAALDLVRTGRAVNRWIPDPALEFLLYDVDRVLRGGGLFWVDHFFCRGADLEGRYAGMIGRLGYRRIKWAVGNKTDASGVRNDEVYLTALLQKPLPKPAPPAKANAV